MSVRQAFDKYAQVYDETRRKFIPCFDEFYTVALRLLPRRTEVPRILDLGAGTGLMSAMVLAASPRARLVLADISEAMLNQARQRFAGKSDAAMAPEFHVADYTRQLPLGPFDAVISALSIHHLSHDQKADLFQRIHETLTPGGIFINADQVLAEREETDALYRKYWFDRIRAAGVTDEEMAGARERMKEDKMSTLADQLAWLDRAGFGRVTCWYQWYNFVVYSGTKAGGDPANRI